MRMQINVDSLILEVTRRCNMACEHCLRGCAESKDMDKKMVDKVLETFDSIYSVTFSGGEPTLNLPLVEYFFEQAEVLGKDIGSFYITTNGKQHQIELAKILLRYYPKMGAPECCGVSLSVDAFHDEVEENFLRGLTFYDPQKEHDISRDDLRWVVKEGSAYNNGFGEYAKCAPDFYCEKTYEDAVLIETAYINVKGEILPGCDLSYDTQNDFVVTDIYELKQYLCETCFIEDAMSEKE